MLSQGRHLAGRDAALTGGMHRRVLACLALWTPVDVVVIQGFPLQRNETPHQNIGTRRDRLRPRSNAEPPAVAFAGRRGQRHDTAQRSAT
jgi:hypothetical protein